MSQYLNIYVSAKGANKPVLLWSVSRTHALSQHTEAPYGKAMKVETKDLLAVQDSLKEMIDCHKDSIARQKEIIKSLRSVTINEEFVLDVVCDKLFDYQNDIAEHNKYIQELEYTIYFVYWMIDLIDYREDEISLYWGIELAEEDVPLFDTSLEVESD